MKIMILFMNVDINANEINNGILIIGMVLIPIISICILTCSSITNHIINTIDETFIIMCVMLSIGIACVTIIIIIMCVVVVIISISSSRSSSSSSSSSDIISIIMIMRCY